jgi:hypothetical protein
MSDRSARIVIVCEDTQHQLFARRVLKQLGVPNRDVRIENAPRGTGDAKQWLREKGLPWEWPAFRWYCRKNSKKRRVLFVVADADDETVRQRIDDLTRECNPAPTIGDHVCFVVPKWAVETWFNFLRGESYDETVRIGRADKYSCAKDCFDVADELARLCQAHSLPPEAPDSLATACNRFAQIKPQLR